MLLKRNLLENITILSSTGTVLCILLNYVTDISLITGIWFPLYILAVFIVSIFLSFKCIQWLLHLNKPIKYDLEAVVQDYPYLAFLKQVLPEVKKRQPTVWKEYDTNELSVISTVLERKLVSSWYVPYVSQEIGFPFACKQMLDQMIGKAFKICHKIETKDVFVDMCTILITHLKEYNKALKRQEKSPSSTIESLYKMSHPISEVNKKYTSADHCTNILRILLKELLPWELWDTPHSELLVRILSKKLDVYIDNTLADPAWVNDKLVTYLTGEEYVDTEENTQNKTSTSSQEQEANIPVIKSPEVVESIVENEIVLDSIVEEQAVNTTQPLDIKTSPVLRQRRGRQGRNEVKIYDRVIEGSVKTWETDMDLQCISLGQDLLASLDGEITLSRLWGQDAEPESSPERQGGKSPQPLWFGEEEAVEAECSDRAASPGALLKDLHSTVSSARARIEGLQVHPPPDEAAGMMEGLLDFGIAGLKKGLRFTGLSDDSQDKSPFPRDKSARGSPEARHKHIPTELAVNPLMQKDGEATNGAPHLVKQQRVTSQDSVTPAVTVFGVGVGESGEAESPEPQYEEAADLSTSIAKLRCLLRQRAEPDARGDDIWWEGAEETRGRTQHHHSSRPVDTATLADEYDMSMDRNSSPNQTSNNMQRLDKLFHRTVTGVFNSLKTAVGGEEDTPPHHDTAVAPLPDWTYVCTTNIELSVCGAASRAAAARRAARVDAALDSLTLPDKPTVASDPEDMEEWVWSRGRAWCAACGAACDARGVSHVAVRLFTALLAEEWVWSRGRAWCAACGAACDARGVSHVAVRLLTALLADVAETLLSNWLADLSEWLRMQVFLTFQNMNEESSMQLAKTTRPLDAELTARLLLDKFTALQLIFGCASVSEASHTIVTSATHRSINKDIVYRALDLMALHFKTAAGLRNPSFDNN